MLLEVFRLAQARLSEWFLPLFQQLGPEDQAFAEFPIRSAEELTLSSTVLLGAFSLRRMFFARWMQGRNPRRAHLFPHRLSQRRSPPPGHRPSEIASTTVVKS